MSRKVVLFDLGGTLLVMRRDKIFHEVTLEEGLKASVNRIHSAYSEAESGWLKRYGYRRLSPERSMESYRRLDAMVFRLVFPTAGSNTALEFSRQMRKRWPELEERFQPRLYPDAEPTLERLKDQGFTLGLVSNAPPDTLGLIQRLGLGRFMSTMVISGLVGLSKPNPAIFRLALRSVQARPSEAVHIGDVYEADIAGARSAGVKGILIDRSGSNPKYDCPTVRNLTEVERLIHGMD